MPTEPTLGRSPTRAPGPPPRRRVLACAAVVAGRVAATVVVVLVAIWSAFALGYRLPLPEAGRWGVAALWAVFALVVVVALWRRRRMVVPVGVYALAFAGLLGWWQTIVPSHDREWADDVARLLDAQVEGSVITLTNVRDFEWRAETDYTPRWVTRRVDLDRLRTVDTALSYWMGPAIAHTLVSFGFDDGAGGLEHLVFSIEIRKERGEAFSAIAGFFKQYELSLVAAGERDLLRVRSNVRGEDVTLYSVAMSREAMRSLFLAYVDEARGLRRQAQWYDTITANCTTIVYAMAKRIVPGLPMDPRLIASGYLPGYLYGLGVLAPGYSLEELERAGRITERAKAAEGRADFSAAIRVGVPQVPAR